jgi:membrane protein implicated in regulation of membrane protease activity
MRMPNSSQLIIIGIAIVFGIPAIAAIIVGHFYGGAAGLGAGILLCAIVLSIAHRRIMGATKKKDNKDKDEITFK